MLDSFNQPWVASAENTAAPLPYKSFQSIPSLLPCMPLQTHEPPSTDAQGDGAHDALILTSLRRDSNDELSHLLEGGDEPTHQVLG